MIKVTLMNKTNLTIAGLALLIAGFGFLGGITTERVLLGQESSGAQSIAEQLIQGRSGRGDARAPSQPSPYPDSDGFGVDG
jgi:hypothetical protein